PRVGPGPGHGEVAVVVAGLLEPGQLRLGPRGDPVVALDLRPPVALDELGAVRRAVLRVEQVEGRVGGDGVELVDHRGVHPGGEDVGAAQVRRQGDVAVGCGQLVHARHGPVVDRGTQRRVDGLGLVGGHERPAPRVAQQHHGVDPRLLAQPADADADVHQRLVEPEVPLVAAEPGVPAQEAEAAPGHVVGEVVLGEVDLVVGGDQRHLGAGALGGVVEALAGVPARARAGGAGGGAGDEGAGDHRTAASIRLASTWPRSFWKRTPMRSVATGSVRFPASSKHLGAKGMTTSGPGITGDWEKTNMFLSSNWDRAVPSRPGEVPIRATGLPWRTEAPSGREIQSKAFFSTPGTPPLYSGVATISASAAAISSRIRVTAGGSWPSRSSLKRGNCPSRSLIVTVTPSGASRAADSISSRFHERLRRLPTIP